MRRTILFFLAAGAAWAGDTVSWETLGQVKLVAEGTVYVPRFPDAVLKLDAKEVTLRGFMMPLAFGDKQTHFVLVSGEPEAMVEVKSSSGLKYSLDPVVVKGRLELVKNDPGAGVFYRLHDALPAAK